MLWRVSHVFQFLRWCSCETLNRIITLWFLICCYNILSLITKFSSIFSIRIMLLILLISFILLKSSKLEVQNILWHLMYENKRFYDLFCQPYAAKLISAGRVVKLDNGVWLASKDESWSHLVHIRQIISLATKNESYIRWWQLVYFGGALVMTARMCVVWIPLSLTMPCNKWNWFVIKLQL